MAQKNNLNGGGVPAAPGGTTAWNDLFVLNVPHAAQMVWHAYQDTSCTTVANYPFLASRMNYGTGSPCVSSTVMLKQAIDTGKGYGTKWQEVYELDIKNLGAINDDPDPAINSAWRDVIAYGHTQLYVP